MNMNRNSSGSWWDRNWKWAVPALCAGALAIFVGFVALIILFVMGVMKSSEPYKEAVAIAASSEIVAKELGTDAKPGFLVGGRIKVSGPSGEANLIIPFSGSKASGAVHAVAGRSGNVWHLTNLELGVGKSDKRFDLLQRSFERK